VESKLKQAIKEWSVVLVSSDEQGVRLLIPEKIESCTASHRQVPAVLYPENQQEVIACLNIASQYNIAIYPVSTGHNWGYGDSLPVEDNCVLFNLSKMNQVIDFNPDTGIVTLQPGVTQRLLGEYLEENNYPYLIPVTGAGPDCSIIGNAIERGYGITPHADHFFSIMSLQAVLADGSVYQSALNRFAGKELDDLHKWGIGPYLDGLFTQSNYGIITQMSIRLAPIPESVEAFFFSITKAEDLKDITLKIQKVLRSFNGITGSINLMNQLRILSMIEKYPAEKLEDGLIPEQVVATMASKRQILLWTGTGALYGNKAIVRAAKKEIRKILRPTAKRIVFFTPGKIDFIYSLLKKIPYINQTFIIENVSKIHKTLQLLAGRPSEIALPLAYWLSGNKPADNEVMQPDKDGCGLIWYSPLVEMNPDKVDDFTKMVKEICVKNKIEPLITLTSLSDLCFDCTIPLLFDKTNPEAVAHAHDCYAELFIAGRQRGYVPYRLNIDSMKYLREYKAIPDIAIQIKKALDPKGIISPGRYTL
jgi:4-cresol dehydrogenase (hydroxylating)